MTKDDDEEREESGCMMCGYTGQRLSTSGVWYVCSCQGKTRRSNPDDMFDTMEEKEM